MPTYRNTTGFTTTEVQKLTGVSARKLRWWDRQGLAGPDKVKNRKRWQRRRYTLHDVVCILVVKALRERGISLQRIREIATRAKTSGVEHPLARLRVACLAHAIVLREDGNFVEPLSGQMVIEEALEKIRPKLDRKRFTPGERAVRRISKHFEKKVATF